MESALIALVGVLAGILLNEYFRKRNLVEVYSQKVFDKHLKVHEDLLNVFRCSYLIISEILEDKNVSSEKYDELYSSAVSPLFNYLDDNEMYISEYLIVQALTAFADAQEFYKITDLDEREKTKSYVRECYKTTRKIIIEESGVAEISRHFRKISKSNPDSPIIRHMKKEEKRCLTNRLRRTRRSSPLNSTF